MTLYGRLVMAGKLVLQRVKQSPALAGGSGLLAGVALDDIPLLSAFDPTENGSGGSGVGAIAILFAAGAIVISLLDELGELG